VESLPRYWIVGLGTAVQAIVVRPAVAVVPDGAVPGHVDIGRGGMICNTLAVSAALGARTAGIIASGDDMAGARTRESVERSGVEAAHVITGSTPATVTIVTGAQRTHIMGVAGEREADLDPEAVEDAWGSLQGQSTWAMLTLPALDSSAGQRFVQLARQGGASIAVTLSSAGHVTERVQRLESLLLGVDLVVGNTDETAALDAAGALVPLLIATDGERGADIRLGVRRSFVPAAPAVVVDTTGAGDAFAAGLLTALDPSDLADLEAISRAVWAGHEAAAGIVGLAGAEPGSGRLGPRVPRHHAWDLAGAPEGGRDLRPAE
jgi:sugar/nucleoside kinase (ribokinase family)